MNTFQPFFKLVQTIFADDFFNFWRWFLCVVCACVLMVLRVVYLYTYRVLPLSLFVCLGLVVCLNLSLPLLIFWDAIIGINTSHPNTYTTRTRHTQDTHNHTHKTHTPHHLTTHTSTHTPHTPDTHTPSHNTPQDAPPV